jgi:hypothetical protein
MVFFQHNLSWFLMRQISKTVGNIKKVLYLVVNQNIPHMRKLPVAALVGGIIIFIVQALSWTVLNIHYKSQAYTPKQDSIMAFLKTQDLKSGQYFMPTVAPGASMDEQTKLMNASAGKPWAVLAYHKALNTSMAMSMIKVFFVNIIIVWLLCWILVQIKEPSFITIFLACLFTGAIVYLNSPYTYHIWYQTPGQLGYVIDHGVQWGLTGLWLGWWLRRGVAKAS